MSSCIYHAKTKIKKQYKNRPRCVAGGQVFTIDGKSNAVNLTVKQKKWLLATFGFIT
jgi:hypothetical protein